MVTYWRIAMIALMKIREESPNIPSAQAEEQGSG